MANEIDTVARVFKAWGYLLLGLTVVAVFIGSMPVIETLVARGSEAVLPRVALVLAVTAPMLGLGGLTAWAGRGLHQRRERARTVALGLAVLSLPAAPVGTIVGYYTLAVLLKPVIKAQFHP